MRILLVTPFRLRYANVLQYVQRFRLGLSVVHAAIQYKRFAYLPTYRFQRVKAGHGVLHYHGNFLAAYFRPFPFRFELGQIHSFKKYLALIYGAVFVK